MNQGRVWQADGGTAGTDIQGVAWNDTLIGFNGYWPFYFSSGVAVSFNKLGVHMSATLYSGTSLGWIWVFFLETIRNKG